MFSDVCLVACYCKFGLVMKLLLYWICTQLCSFMKSAKDWIVHSLCFRYNLIFTKTLFTTLSALTSLLIASAATSNCTTSLSKHARPFPSGKTGSKRRSFCLVQVCATARAVAAPWRMPHVAISLAQLRMSSRWSTSRSPMALTMVQEPFAAQWRA